MDRPVERTTYLIAIAGNLLLLYATHNLWHVVPFLTDDFRRVIWPVTASLLVGVVVNLAYLAFDPRWFKSMTNVGVLGVSLAVTIRMYQVFPFDFSAFAFDWAPVVATLLWVVMVGTAVAMVIEAVRTPLALFEWLDERSARSAGNDDQEATMAHMSTMRAE